MRDNIGVGMSPQKKRGEGYDSRVGSGEEEVSSPLAPKGFSVQGPQ